jgi:hypothetical protein
MILNESLLIDYVVQQAVSVYFGQMFVLGLVLMFVLLATLMYNGMPFGSSLIVSLPILMLMGAMGLFGGYGWITQAILVVIGITYAIIMTRMFTK